MLRSCSPGLGTGLQGHSVGTEVLPMGYLGTAAGAHGSLSLRPAEHPRVMGWQARELGRPFAGSSPHGPWPLRRPAAPAVPGPAMTGQQLAAGF